MKRLINILDPIEFESLESFLARLGKANYYKNKNWYKSLLPELRPSANSISDDTIRVLSDLTTVEIETLRKMIRGYLFETSPLIAEANNRKYRRYKFSPRYRAKACPECLQENGAWLIPWNYSFITGCPKHLVLLIGECPNCGKNIRRGRTRCLKCGYSVTDIKSRKLNPHNIEVDYVIFIWDCLKDLWGFDIIYNENFNSPNESITKLVSPSEFVLFINYYSKILNIYKINKLNDHLDTSNTPSIHLRSRQATSEIEKEHFKYLFTFSLLLDWPIRLHKSLIRMAKTEVRYIQNQFKKQQKVKKKNNVLWELIYSFRFFTPSYCWFWKEVSNLITDNFSQIPEVNYWAVHFRKIPGNEEGKPLLVTRKEASRILQVNHSGKLKKLITQGKLTPISILGRSQTQKIIKYLPFDQIENLKIEQGVRAITQTKVLSLLGINRYKVILLISNGFFNKVIPKIISRSNSSWYDEKQILTFLNQVLDNCVVKDFPGNKKGKYLIPKTTKENNLYHKISFIQTIHAIINNSIPAYYDSKRNGLAGIWLSINDINSNKDNKEKMVIPQHIAHKKLKCSFGSLVKLTDLGLIESTEIDGRRMYTQDQINTYLEKYCLSNDVMEIIGASRGQMQRLRRKKIINPVSGPGIDTMGEYRYLKADILKYRDQLQNQTSKD